MMPSPKRLKHQGLVQVYTGNGKGKTTAALGVGLRAVGHGFRVYMIQFMKGQINYGELEAVKHLPNFTIRQFGRAEFVDRRNPDLKDIALAKAALQHAREVMAGGKVDFLILDEVNCAIDWGLVTEEEVVDLIRSRPPQGSQASVSEGHRTPSWLRNVALRPTWAHPERTSG
jgi:cob(I)alamin adenosyltransferase